MQIRPMTNSNNRYHYYRCANPRSEQYTNVAAPLRDDQLAFLKTQFAEVQLVEDPGYDTLPAWRLYIIAND